jgi:RNase H-fold protein (predicted Holliday junction resolvase)
VQRIILAIDPGRSKCGLALVSGAGPLFRAVVPTAEIGLTCHYLLQQHPAAEVIMGEGTSAAQVAAMVRQILPDLAITLVPERNSTLRARGRYFQDQPPPWWQRLLPSGMRVPPRPVDDYAAVVMAEEFLA